MVEFLVFCWLFIVAMTGVVMKSDIFSIDSGETLKSGLGNKVLMTFMCYGTVFQGLLHHLFQQAFS